MGWWWGRSGKRRWGDSGQDLRKGGSGNNLKVKERVFKTCGGRRCDAPHLRAGACGWLGVWRSVRWQQAGVGLRKGGRKGNWLQTCSSWNVALRIFVQVCVGVGRGRGVEIHPRCFCTNPNSSFDKWDEALFSTTPGNHCSWVSCSALCPSFPCFLSHHPQATCPFPYTCFYPSPNSI